MGWKIACLTCGFPLYSQVSMINNQFNANLTSEFPVIQVSKTEDKIITEKIQKQIISEISLKVILNNMDFVSLLCLNEYQEELALGFLFTEAMIDSMQDIKDVSFNEQLMAVIINTKSNKAVIPKETVRSVTSGCGKGLTYINPLKLEKFGKVDSDFQVPITKIWELMQDFNKQSELYRNIGGVHSVNFYNDNFSVFNEDIGRHNCVDKIAGILLKEDKLDYTKESLIITSGRVSSEILIKCLRLKVPIVVSRSAPTAAVVEMAQKFNITLLGYVRGTKANIYTGEERILGL
ncbi:formate dehydrogenase accessory sulfurtransferase FdhD [Candidatus Margulisiibacteriota bacterium]